MTDLRIAYLDISPRQTGKTERLIQHAKLCLSAGQIVRFVTSDGLAEDIQRRLPGAQILLDGDDPHEALDGGIWFYDEFDWLKSTKIRSGAYYATTPKFQRVLGVHTAENDLLLRLVQTNEGHFRRYSWAISMDDTVKEARLQHTPEQFRLLYLGEFLQ